MPPRPSDERAALKRLFDGAIADVGERTRALRRWSDYLEGLAAREISGGLRVALRETAEALRFLQEDIIDRMSALGHAINGLHEMGEL
jgi:hypothetical protein